MTATSTPCSHGFERLVSLPRPQRSTHRRGTRPDLGPDGHDRYFRSWRTTGHGASYPSEHRVQQLDGSRYFADLNPLCGARGNEHRQSSFRASAPRSRRAGPGHRTGRRITGADSVRTENDYPQIISLHAGQRRSLSPRPGRAASIRRRVVAVSLHPVLVLLPWPVKHGRPFRDATRRRSGADAARFEVEGGSNGTLSRICDTS